MRKIKDSGVAWIGVIPENWQLLSVGALFKVRNEKVNDTDYPPLSVTKGGIVPQMESVAKSDATDNRKMILKNDFVINSRSDRKQSCGVSPLDGSVSLINTVLHPVPNAPVLPDYLDYLLKNYGFAEEFYRWGHGIVADLWTTRWQEMKNIFLPIPPVEEQQKIIFSISTQMGKVDALIANVQEQIEKLKAYKQSLITEVVTKGLDPNVPMKDSGVEWIGKIPVSWGIAKLQYCAKIRSGITLGKKYPDGAELIERPYLRVANVQNGGVVLDDLKTIEVSAEEDAQYRLSAGEVLMTEGGDRDKLGRGCVWLGQVEPCLHQNHIFALRTNKLLNPYFLSYVTASKIGRVYFDITAIKTTNLACTNSSKVLAFKLPLPSAGEQQQMVDYLDRQVDKIDKLISAKQSKIEKLEQYKRSLIYEYVTGKKEVS